MIPTFLSFGWETTAYVVSGVLYGTKWLIWGHQETEMEKVSRQLDELHHEVEELRDAKPSAPPAKNNEVAAKPSAPPAKNNEVAAKPSAPPAENNEVAAKPSAPPAYTAWISWFLPF